MIDTMYFDDSIGAVSFQTIRRGSTGPDVVAWQRIIGVEPDGKFGPQTEAVTRKWQQDHGLDADGIVGPKTWGAASSKALEAGIATKRNLLLYGGALTIGGIAWWLWKRRKRGS